jgi:hypothetical protein
MKIENFKNQIWFKQLYWIYNPNWDSKCYILVFNNKFSTINWNTKFILKLNLVMKIQKWIKLSNKMTINTIICEVIYAMFWHNVHSH